MAPVTPKTSRVLQVKDSNTSSQKKLKQSSLLSFFSKQKKSEVKSPTTTKINEEQKLKYLKDPISKKSDSEENTASNKNKVLESSLPSSSTTDIATEDETILKIKQQPSSDDSIDLRDNMEVETTFDENSFSPQSKTRRQKRTVNYNESDDDDDDDNENLPLSTTSKATKRKKQRLFTHDDDDDDDEYIPNKNSNPDEEDDEEDNAFYENSQISIDEEDDDDDDILSLADRKVTPTPKSKIKTPLSRSNNTKTIKPVVKKPVATTSKNKNFNKQNEERYHWLVNEKDAQSRPPTDPEYDPRTLYIPSSAWNKFTPFEKQYWEIKSKMWDCIVFFKKGKFFELYEKDAFLANSLFDWKLAGNGRANMQLAGIPEMSFEYWAAQFIDLGYKVAKVDQKESMLAKEMREGSKGIVKRELESVLTSGTLTDGDMIHTDLATYCLAIREESGNFYNYKSGTEPNSNRIFGIAFIDTSTGETQLIEFIDDNECTKLDTIMSQVKPKEIVMERNNLSSLALKIVKFNAAQNAIFNNIKPEKEFYDFEKTYNVLISEEGQYFENESKWPQVLQDFYKNEKKVGFSAFGGLLYYLKWLNLDKNLVSMGNIKEYNPIKSQNSLILDGITLQNLEIFSNTFDGSDRGTLFRLFNKAITPMGKRMMRTWLMHPLLHKSDIEKRLDSVDLLLSNTDLRRTLEENMAKFPDLERMLSRIHSCSIKVKDFENVIKGFEDIATLVTSIKDLEIVGALKEFVRQIPSALFEDVEKWATAFDRVKAIKENVIVPHRGIEPDFDKSLEEIATLENELNVILQQYRKHFKCSNINFKDSGKELYTIEIPVSATKYVPSSWVQMAANKSKKRYYSDEVRTLARCMAEARETHKILEEDLKNRLCKKFDAHFNSTWMPTIHAISNIDCLLALTRTSESLGFPSCRPVFVDEIDEETGNKLNGFVKFKSLRHPCFNEGSTVIRDFIPNDIELGRDKPQLGLLTGANAAGKSTILRITCIAVIMAQMGCYIPCVGATLSPIDRIMTRLGANDNIMQGKSTFFVELSETKKILDMATNRSLLVVDELGRGGSSSDGFAIAESVLYHTATHIQSLGFFATHYGTLGLQFTGHPQVRPMRMSILVDEKTRKVTFLYKLEDGASEGSFGMHVASMCDIPKSIVDNAEIAAEDLEHTFRLIKESKFKSNQLKDDEIVNIPNGLQSDLIRIVFGSGLTNNDLGTGEGATIYDSNIKGNVLNDLFKTIENLDN